jgi:hypothetical protein
MRANRVRRWQTAVAVVAVFSMTALGAEGETPETARALAAGPLRQEALKHMPAKWNGVVYDVLTDKEKAEVKAAIAAWEQLRDLEPKDLEVQLNLGICLASQVQYELLDQLNQHHIQEETQACALRATHLVEEVLKAQPTEANGKSYVSVIGVIFLALPERAAEMDQYVLKHAALFPEYELQNAHVRLARVPDRMAGELEAAVAESAAHPETVVWIFTQVSNHQDADVRLKMALPYTKSKDALARFFAEYVVAETLYRERKDPAALEHYDRMLADHEAAYTALAKFRGHQLMVDDVFRYRFNACLALGKPEEAKATIKQGCDYYLAAKRYNTAIGFVYFYAVTEVLGKDDPAAALKVADVFLAAKARSMDGGDEAWARAVAEYRAIHGTTEKVPDFGAMTPMRGAQSEDLRRPRMAAGAGKLWLAMQHDQQGGGALMVAPGKDEATALELPATQRSVAAVGNRIYFGGRDGLYQVDGEDGHEVRHWKEDPQELPAKQIVDLCAVGDDLYFTWRDGDRYGVGVLNPTTGNITSLAPSGSPATLREPTRDAYRIFWDAAGDQILVNNNGSPGLTRMGWVYAEGKWVSTQDLLVAISNGTETLTISGMRNKQVLRLRGMKDVALTLPDITLAPEPAFNKTTVFLPTDLGLYEIDRVTGRQKWVAHQDATPCLSAVTLGDAVYVMSTRGLYRYGVQDK